VNKTKIIATLGPATDPEPVLEKMLLAGMDLARLNMSHGYGALHAARIEQARFIAQKLNKRLEFLIDLQGPKIRLGKFVNQKISLQVNQPLILDPDIDPAGGTNQAVYVDYANLYRDLTLKDILLLDDGKIILEVEAICENKIHCIAKNNGTLSDHKGINKLDGGLSAPSITDKDEQDLLLMSQLDIDYCGLSFVKNSSEIQHLRNLIKKTKTNIKIFAKIETKQAVSNLEEIIQAADGIMVARGDLGVELGLSKLPVLQKHILQVANTFDKPAIVATQMMYSMINSPSPTRAEVMDVANAILDGADGITLSEETAIGEHPALVVRYVQDICQQTEKLLLRV
jgi:pyruvate kinase